MMMSLMQNTRSLSCSVTLLLLLAFVSDAAAAATASLRGSDNQNNLGQQAVVCHSKGFFYHGGSCPEDFLGDCQDLGKAPEEEALVVVSNVHDPSIVYFAGFVHVGGQFQLMRSDSGDDMPDVYKISIHSPENQEMLQTMTVEAPCTTEHLESLPASSVQLIFIASEPMPSSLEATTEE
jgi:hypothetical protein